MSVSINFFEQHGWAHSFFILEGGEGDAEGDVEVGKQEDER